MNRLLFVITVLSVMINLITAVALLGPSPSRAEVAGMGYRELARDRDFRKAVERVIDDHDISDKVREVLAACVVENRTNISC